nr:Ig-like domain-containing protein [Lachnospiraceae bacterium]
MKKQQIVAATLMAASICMIPILKNPVNVYADEITGFEELSEETIYTEYKLGLERLEEEFPEQIEVYTDEETVETVDVTWECVDDYDELLGTYVFQAVLPDEDLVEGVELPTITVVVENEGIGTINGYVEEPTTYEIPDSDNALVSSPSGSGDSYFNGFEAGYLPVLRDQGSEGACWAFGNIGAVEADLIKSGYANQSIDLSELQLAYFSSHSFDDPKDCHDNDTVSYSGSNYLSNGGNAAMAYRCLINKVGAVEEKYVPYRRGATYVPDEKYAISQDYAQVKNVYNIPISDRAGIKAAIRAHGGVAASFYASASDTYCATYNSYYSTRSSVNHAVMIVGWDDNFPKEHFLEGSQPSSDGAWLMRNSWGLNDYGYHGYFWISYEDAGLLYSNHVVAYDADTNVYDNSYSYAIAPATRSYYGLSSGSTLAQNYNVDIGEEIKAVGIELATSGVNVSVTVTAGGKTATGSVNTTYAGYYAITLNRALSIEQSSEQAVVVTYTFTANSQIGVFYENIGSMSLGSIHYNGAHGGSATINGSQVLNNDPCVFLFTDNTNSNANEKVIELRQDSFEGHTGTTFQIQLTAASEVAVSDLTWSSVDDEVATVNSTGLITVGSCKGTAVIVGTYPATGQTVECEVTVLPYNITYVLDNDVVYVSRPNTFYPGDSENCSVPISYLWGKQGYNYPSWYYDADFTSQATTNNLMTKNEDVTLYPKWTKKTRIRIKCYIPEKNGDAYVLGSYTSTTSNITSSGTSIDDCPVTLPNASNAAVNPNNYAPEGYIFSYWSMDAEGNNPIEIATADFVFNLHREYALGAGNYRYIQNTNSCYVYPQYERDTRVTGVSLNTTTLSLEYGSTTRLTATVAPSFAANKSVVWSTTNSSVATVDQSGNVTAVSGSGTATIRVTTSEGGFVASCTVTATSKNISGASVTLGTQRVYNGQAQNAVISQV